MRADSYNADTVNTIEPPPFLRFTYDKIVKAYTPTFFHPFKAELHIDRQIKSKNVMSFEDIQPAKDRTFVIRGTSPIHSPRVVVDAEFEGFGVPSIAFASLMK